MKIGDNESVNGVLADVAKSVKKPGSSKTKSTLASAIVVDGSSDKVKVSDYKNFSADTIDSERRAKIEKLKAQLGADLSGTTSYLQSIPVTDLAQRLSDEVSLQQLLSDDSSENEDLQSIG